MKNCIVGQSGGPTAVINGSLAGVIEGAKSAGFDNIYGAVGGIEGVLKDRFFELGDFFADPGKLALLRQTPAAFLGSCRYKLPVAVEKPDVYQAIFETFDRMDIAAFFYIGGNDSMDAVLKLSGYAKKIGSPVRFVGIPKTIDNDLPLTDHTPGFGSAAKYIAATVQELARDTAVYDLESVLIVEIMGRNAGWLTASSCLARSENCTAPHIICLPEIPFDTDLFLEKVKDRLQKNKQVIVCISEGMQTADGAYVCEQASSGLSDTFGHKYLSGAGKTLEILVREKLGCKVRSVELNVCQRAAAHLLSKTDLTEAEEIGNAAVCAAENGETGIMMRFVRQSDAPYQIQIQSTAVENCANLEKTVPKAWISSDGFDVTDDMTAYLKPLIAGEISLSFKDGLPQHICR